VKLLGDYVDGSLPADQAAALERHLSMCMPCITFMRTYKATGHLCRAKLAREMPKELKQGLSSFLASRVPGFAPPASAAVPADSKVEALPADPSAAAQVAKKAT
jgi:anti-sigma factor RsiW